MPSELLPICLIMAGLFSAVFIIAGVSKYREASRARSWLVTTGTVMESKVRSHRRRSSEGDSFESEPLVTYEYTVEGVKYRGAKINFAEKISGEEIAPMLNKYPEGKIVLVYYNPAKPSEAVLERELPSGVFKIVGVLVLIILGFGVVAPFAFDFISNWVATVAPNGDNAAPATIMFGMGLGILLLAFATQRQVWAMRNWSIAAGKILDASVQARKEWDPDSEYRTYYNSEVVYSFLVRDQQYISDRVSFGGKYRGAVMGSTPGFVKSSLQKYPKGASVQVYYNPNNPSECVLERPASGQWLLLVVGLGMMGAAQWILGFKS
jgi:uncharacterized protein DUF3592